MNSGFQDYTQRMALPRERFAGNPAVTAVLSPTIDPALLELFLINFCALGVPMTAPVEGWIRRAGERCEALGFAELGRALKGHARGEADHHLLMIADTQALTAHWNAHRTPPLDHETLLEQPLSAGIIRYVELHEQTINGEAPYAQIAIEYEIEMLSLSTGQQLTAHSAEQLGADILGCLSFLTDHVEIDASHTKFNARQLDRFLVRNPDGVDALVAAGTAALDSYAQFFSDCLERAVCQSGQWHAAG